MRKIRKNVFETNSSSSHSIVLGDSVLEFSKGDDITDFVIEPDEFGWEYEEHYDLKTKASYVYTYALSNKSKCEEVKNRLKKVVEEKLGVNVVFTFLSEEYFPKGYIDHQSHDVCEEVAFDEEKMKLFLFNENSVLTINNDN